jgi:hypothetical protein
VANNQVERMQATCIDVLESCRFDGEQPWLLALRGERVGYLQPSLMEATEFRCPEQLGWMSALRQGGVRLSMQALELVHALLATPPDVVAGQAGAGGAGGAVAGGSGGGFRPHAFVYFRDGGFRAEVPSECRWLYDLDYLPPGGEAGVANAEHYSVCRTEEEYGCAIASSAFSSSTNSRLTPLLVSTPSLLLLYL